VAPGGSAANTIVALQMLGTQCALVGMIGKDEMGVQYRNRLEHRGITPHLTESENDPTAQVLCLVTPDGQRTMRCFLGASSGFNTSHLKEEQFQGIKLLHCEGYSLYNNDGDMVLEAMMMAKRAGAKVSLDLASFELVRHYKTKLLQLLDNYVDIVFCNEDEAKVLHPDKTVEQTLQILASMCQVAVITLGSEGCLVASGTQRIHCPTTPIDCVDTTGAGDIFASGFLHMYLRGYSLKECCHVAHLLGGAILSEIGAQLPDSVWEELLQKIRVLKTASRFETVVSTAELSIPKRVNGRLAAVCTI